MKNRKTSLELLRIISMCGIIAMHYLHMGKAIENYADLSFAWYLNSFVYSFGASLVNCFVLITGYFLIHRSTFSLRKPVDLLLITFFYGLVSWIIAVFVGAVPLSLSSLIKAVVPFIHGKRWFVETYIMLILFAPFINVLLRNITRSQYRLLLGIQLVIFSIWYSTGLRSPLLDDGYGITNFLTLYMIGGYIGLHEVSVEKISMRTCAIAYVICGLMNFVLNYFVYPFGYAYFTNILGAVSAFVFFLKWDLGTHAALNKVSTSAFDVYFVHSDFNTSYLLFSGLLGTQYIANTVWIIPHMMMVIPFVWLLGYCSHFVRTKLFNTVVNPILARVHVINKRYIIGNVV